MLYFEKKVYHYTEGLISKYDLRNLLRPVNRGKRNLHNNIVCFLIFWWLKKNGFQKLSRRMYIHTLIIGLF